MADIATMRETTMRRTWVPATMTDGSALPKIASFAKAHDPALLFANLLQQFQLNRLAGLERALNGYDWYQGQGTSGYFCRYGNLACFVQGARDMINNQMKMDKTLALFKEKYERTNSPSEPTSEELKKLCEEVEKRRLTSSEESLQEIARTLKERNKLTIAALLQADQDLHGCVTTSCQERIRLFRYSLPAAPHVHTYAPLFVDSQVFVFGGVFMVFDQFVENESKGPLLFRPHAFLAYKDELGETKYTSSANLRTDKTPWVQWPEITSTVTWADGESRGFRIANFCIHGSAPDVAISCQEPLLGDLNALLGRGPFVTEITAPDKYTAKTLHFLLTERNVLPTTSDKLLEYFRSLELSFEQQGFIIRQLFPFLKV